MKGRRGDVRSCMLVSNSPPSSQPHVPETLCIGVTFGLDESRAPAAPQRRSDIFFILVMGGRRELVARAKDASTSKLLVAPLTMQRVYNVDIFCVSHLQLRHM